MRKIEMLLARTYFSVFACCQLRTSFSIFSDSGYFPMAAELTIEGKC
jgi:hypothetical protein